MLKATLWRYFLVFGLLAGISLQLLPTGLAEVIQPRSGTYLMERSKEKELLAAIPRINHAYFNKLLDGFLPAEVIFYTENEIPFAHQDHGQFHLSSVNYSVDKSQPGNNFEFPWKHAGGCDNANVYTWKVMVLPQGSKIKVFRTEFYSIFSNQSPYYGYDWEFPVGTIFFEFLSFGDELLVFEVRTREKRSKGWHMGLWRPYPTADSLAESITNQDYKMMCWFPQAKLNYFSDNYLHRLRNFGLYADTVKMSGFSTRKQVRQLLSKPFENCIGEVWSNNYCYCPSTDDDNFIVPKGYIGNIVGNSQQSCMNCHKDATEHVGRFDSRDWYGFVRGSKYEKILSFHPIAPEYLNRGIQNIEPRLNPKLANLLE